MANTKIDLAELFRQIQHLNLKQESDPEKEMKLDFYKTIFLTFFENLDSHCFQTLIPICFKICPIDKAKQYADSLGLTVVEGKFESYLSFSKSLEL